MESRDAGRHLSARLDPHDAARWPHRHAITFVVDTAHCQYCGDLPIERAAHHIAFAEGRRGACRDYLANTVAHARALHIHDPYIEELVERVASLRDGTYVIPTVQIDVEAVGEA